MSARLSSPEVHNTLKACCFCSTKVFEEVRRDPHPLRAPPPTHARMGPQGRATSIAKSKPRPEQPVGEEVEMAEK